MKSPSPLARTCLSLLCVLTFLGCSSTDDAGGSAQAGATPEAGAGGNLGKADGTGGNASAGAGGSDVLGDLDEVDTRECEEEVDIEVATQAPLEDRALSLISRLNALIELAETNGNDMLREKMSVRTAEVFLEFANWDEQHLSENETHFALMSNFADDATQLAADLPEFERQEVVLMLEEALETTRDLLTCKIRRKGTPIIDWSKASIEGNTVTHEGRPVFLGDYTWKPATPTLQEFYGARDGTYLTPSYVDDESGTIRAWVAKDLRDKPDGRFGSVFHNHTAFPDWANSKYENFTDGARHYNAYDIDHPGARELQSLLLEGTVPLMAGKKYTELGHMLSNEPAFPTKEGAWNTGGVSSYTMAKFRNWLKEKHGNIAALNSLWATSFGDFDAISITIPIDGAEQGSALWYDWCVFNGDRVEEWFSFMRNEIRRHDPAARVHIKLMPWLWVSGGRDHGIDMEALTRLSDISGSDASSNNSNIWGTPRSWENRYAFDWKTIGMIYDLFRSVNPDKIIYDSETHFLSTVNFRDLYLKAEYARATYWLAHLHGLNVNQTWVWGRDEDGAIVSNVGEGQAGSNTQQPRIVNAVAATLMDLNSYSEEITRIQQARKAIRVFYSQASAVSDDGYMDDVYASYEALDFDGVPLGFATGDILARQKASDWDVVVVHATPRVTDREFATLQAYLNAGGTVIVDANSLSQDEYGRARSGALKGGSGSLLESTSLADTRLWALQTVNAAGHSPAFSLEESNATGADGCIWRTTEESDGDPVITIVNVGKTEASIELDYQQAQAGTLVDLFTGREVAWKSTVPPNGVVLLKLRN